MVDLRKARAAIITFGHRVRAHRRAAGITQSQLAGMAFCTRKFIWEIERGRPNPSLESMVLIAEALDCDVTELLHAEPVNDSN